MILESFFDSLKTPLDSWEDLLIGGLFLMFSIFLVPLIFLNGYIIKSIRSFLRRKGKIPSWEGWSSLFKDGVSATVIFLSYLLIIALISMLVSQIPGNVDVENIRSGYEDAQVGGLPNLGEIFAYGILTILASVVVLALIPMSFIAYATTGNLFSAYKFHEIIVAIGASPFNYFKIFVLNFLAFLASLMVAAIPVVGIFLLPFVLFYLILVFARMYTRNYLEVAR